MRACNAAGKRMNEVSHLVVWEKRLSVSVTTQKDLDLRPSQTVSQNSTHATWKQPKKGRGMTNVIDSLM